MIYYGISYQEVAEIFLFHLRGAETSYMQISVFHPKPLKQPDGIQFEHVDLQSSKTGFSVRQTVEYLIWVVKTLTFTVEQIPKSNKAPALNSLDIFEHKLFYTHLFF